MQNSNVNQCKQKLNLGAMDICRNKLPALVDSSNVGSTAAFRR